MNLASRWQGGLRCAGLLTAACFGSLVMAQPGKLLLTGGVSGVDGAAGGGLTPWAVIGGPATDEQWGATAFVTTASTQGYRLQVQGLAVGWGDRLEMSLARQDLATGNSLAPLGLTGLHLRQDIVGLKLRVAGDAVLDADTWMPQVAVGVMHKRSDPGVLGPTLFGPLGADRSGYEAYASATKLLLAPGVLLNATLRATRANQGGLLGFGGAQASGRAWQPEVSIAKLLSKGVAVGVEYRAKPDNLNRSVLGAGALKEDAWWDVFLAWAPSKHLSVTFAWVDLGHIAPGVQPQHQSGAYVSAQVGF